MTATVSNLFTAGVPTGTVTFDDGEIPLGTVLLSGGMASLSVSSLGLGAHTIHAVYHGDIIDTIDGAVRHASGEGQGRVAPGAPAGAEDPGADDGRLAQRRRFGHPLGEPDDIGDARIGHRHLRDRPGDPLRRAELHHRLHPRNAEHHGGLFKITAVGESKTYGQDNPDFSVAYDGFVLGQGASVLGGTLAFSTPATNGSHVGNYAVTPSGLTSANYAITFVAGKPARHPRPARHHRRRRIENIWGQSPDIHRSLRRADERRQSSAIAGLSFATVATAASGVGSYPIVPSGGVDPDYTISYVNGTLKINPATLTVTADDKSKVAGEANPGFTWPPTMASVLGDGAAALGGAPSRSARRRRPQARRAAIPSRREA